MSDEIPNQDDAVPATAEQGPGRLLREARQRKQLSLQAVADALHLRVAIIEALERDDYQNLPPLTFAKGYLKAYAKLVEIPEHEAMAAFERIGMEQEEAEPAAPKHSAGQAQRASSGRLLLWILFLVVALLVALWAGRDWLGERFQLAGEGAPEQPVPAEPVVPERPAAERAPEPVAEPTTPDAPPAPEPAVPEPEPAPEPVPQPEREREPEPVPEPVVPEPEDEAVALPQGQLTVRVLGESWVDIRDGEGERLLLGVVEGPRVAEFEAPMPFSLVLGDAAQVEVEFNGEPVDLRPHTRGRVARVTLGEQP